MPKVKQKVLNKEKYQEQLDVKISKMFSEMGKKGGKALLEKKGKKYFSELGKKGMKKRWEKK